MDGRRLARRIGIILTAAVIASAAARSLGTPSGPVAAALLLMAGFSVDDWFDETAATRTPAWWRSTLTLNLVLGAGIVGFMWLAFGPPA